MKSPTNYEQFAALDIRTGRIIQVEPANTKKPTYRLAIDFGHELGIKMSCGAYTNYPATELKGKTVIAVVNFPPKKMGPETSDVLVLGVANETGGTILLTTDQPMGIGVEVF